MKAAWRQAVHNGIWRIIGLTIVTVGIVYGAAPVIANYIIH